jgi:hypothetical protein
VRGKTVDFSAEAINNLLGLPTPLECGVQRRRNELVGKSREDYDVILRELCRSGAKYERFEGSRERLEQHHKAEMRELKHRQAQELALFKFQESQHHQKEA